MVRQLGQHGSGAGLAGSRLATITQRTNSDLAAIVLGRTRAHIDGAGLAARVLLEADHLGAGGQRVARIEQSAEPAIGIAEVGDGVERHVRHAASERQVEGQQIVERRPRQSGHARERRRAVHGEPGAGQRQIQGGIALGHGARRGVQDLLAEHEVLEEVAPRGLAHVGSQVRREIWRRTWSQLWSDNPCTGQRIPLRVSRKRAT